MHLKIMSYSHVLFFIFIFTKDCIYPVKLENTDSPVGNTIFVRYDGINSTETQARQNGTHFSASGRGHTPSGRTATAKISSKSVNLLNASHYTVSGVSLQSTGEQSLNENTVPFDVDNFSTTLSPNIWRNITAFDRSIKAEVSSFSQNQFGTSALSPTDMYQSFEDNTVLPRCSSVSPNKTILTIAVFQEITLMESGWMVSLDLAQIMVHVYVSFMLN